LKAVQQQRLNLLVQGAKRSRWGGYFRQSSSKKGI
jgi:hypothetical protein